MIKAPSNIMKARPRPNPADRRRTIIADARHHLSQAQPEYVKIVILAEMAAVAGRTEQWRQAAHELKEAAKSVDKPAALAAVERMAEVA